MCQKECVCGGLSVMLSVCGAGCDKRSSVAAGWYLSLPLSLYLTHTHSLKRWRKTLLCSPLPPLSEHSAGVPGRGAGLSRQPFVQRILRMTERNTDGETRGGTGELGLRGCRSKCWISAATVLKQAATPNHTASWDFF